MGTGDFDIFLEFKPGLHGGGDVDLEVAKCLAQVLEGECRESRNFQGGRSFRIQGESASAWVADMRENGEFVLPIFVEKSCDVELRYRADCANWSNSLELAHFVFEVLDSSGRYEMFLTHDDDQLVRANFTHPNLGELVTLGGGFVGVR
ncbi:hypothetical protein [Streptomyces arboris]|uniref:Uncharacterized protein n=1 Tax=Streptomyces arboris TaxID=2600619 RepID=A0A5N5EGA9_9ACTN|nr:hypothetical protein [Streptomyces arboris]KAB2587632.1 hypothetical protein F5983_36940 [Streptomyces arboris]